MELDYKAIGKRIRIANALGVTVDDLLYDSIVHARPQLICGGVILHLSHTLECK